MEGWKYLHTTDFHAVIYYTVPRRQAHKFLVLHLKFFLSVCEQVFVNVCLV